MEYASYGFYKDTWGGTMPAPVFNRYCERVSYILDCMTHGKVARLWSVGSDEEKKAISMASCALVDSIGPASERSARAGGLTIASETIGRHSVSYVTPSRSEAARARDIVRPYLCGLSVDGQSLFYRGIHMRRGCCRDL